MQGFLHSKSEILPVPLRQPIEADTDCDPEHKRGGELQACETDAVFSEERAVRADDLPFDHHGHARTQQLLGAFC